VKNKIISINIIGKVPPPIGGVTIHTLRLYQWLKKEKNISSEDIVYTLSILSLIPFSVQRSSLLETSMLILVIAPFIIKYFGPYNKKSDGGLGHSRYRRYGRR
jgi:hypothetical protein